jgi:hypothetical protein
MDKISLRVNINTNCRTDIVIDYTKRSLIKKIVDKLAELTGRGSDNGDTFGRKNSTQSLSDNSTGENAADGEPEQETEDDVTMRTVKRLKEFYSILLNAGLNNIVFRQSSDNEEEKGELLDAATFIKLCSVASTILLPMGKYTLGVRDGPRGGEDDGDQELRTYFLSDYPKSPPQLA